MTIDVRRLGETDTAHFKSIRLEALQTEPLAFASTVEEARLLPETEWVRRVAVSPVFAAFDSETPVGVMGLLPETSTRRNHRATLVMVYVQKAWRGAGVADQLLDAVVDWERAAGIRQIELAVNVDNETAIQFYQRRGFVGFGRLPDAVTTDGVPHDELLMSCSI